MPIFVDELYAHDFDTYCSFVRLSDGTYAVGISLHPGMKYTPLKADPYWGNNKEDAKKAYLDYIKE